MAGKTAGRPHRRAARRASLARNAPPARRDTPSLRKNAPGARRDSSSLGLYRVTVAIRYSEPSISTLRVLRRLLASTRNDANHYSRMIEIAFRAAGPNLRTLVSSPEALRPTFAKARLVNPRAPANFREGSAYQLHRIPKQNQGSHPSRAPGAGLEPVRDASGVRPSQGRSSEGGGMIARKPTGGFRGKTVRA